MGRLWCFWWTSLSDTLCANEDTSRFRNNRELEPWSAAFTSSNIGYASWGSNCCWTTCGHDYRSQQSPDTLCSRPCGIQYRIWASARKLLPLSRRTCLFISSSLSPSLTPWQIDIRGGTIQETISCFNWYVTLGRLLSKSIALIAKVVYKPGCAELLNLHLAFLDLNVVLYVDFATTEV